MICAFLSTFLMAELNNRNALMRVYSRMVSSSFLALIMMSSFMNHDMVSYLSITGFIFFYLILFSAYQDKSSVGNVFYAFAALGMVSLVWVKVLYLLPILWILMTTNILCMSFRTWLSSILGLMAPYWFVIGYYFAFNKTGDLVAHFMPLLNLHGLLKTEMLTRHEIISLVFTGVLFATGAIHFIRHSFNDKIRVRMHFEFFITMGITCIALIIIMPNQFDKLFGLLIINTAPLLSHFITLTHTKVTNIASIIIVLTMLALTAYNLWIP